MNRRVKNFVSSKVISNWRKGGKFYTTWIHILGMVFSGIGTGMALMYGAADQIQHSMLKTWETYLIFFLIFLGALIGRFLKQ